MFMSICRYVASVNQALDCARPDEKSAFVIVGSNSHATQVIFGEGKARKLIFHLRNLLLVDNQ